MRIKKQWRDDPHYSTPPPPPSPDRVSSTVDQAPTDDPLLNGIIRRASFINSQEPHDRYRISPPFVDDTNKLSPHSCVSHNAQLYLPKNQRSFDPPPVMRSTINASICSNQVHHLQILFIPFLLILEARKLMLYKLGHTFACLMSLAGCFCRTQKS
jgi:hypothetical protein